MKKMSNENDRKYDVGIFGLWYGVNYGSQLTYFALNKVLNLMQYSTIMIWNPLYNEDADYTKLHESHPIPFAVRQNYNTAPRLRMNRMKELNNICKRFIIGSDQMWNYNLSRPYRQSYFFDFAEDNRNKIAYATSFGRDKYTGPDDERELTKKNLKRFNAISVRDDFSKRILKNDFDVESTQVVDPVFLCPMNEYEKIAILDQRVSSDEFVFAYILDPTPEMGKVLDDIAEKTRKKIIVVFDLGRNDDEAEKKLACNSKNIIVSKVPTVETWLGYVKYSSFVLTDSFHGACFSAIFHKEFVVQKNIGRGGGRFDCLLNMMGLIDRMVQSPQEINERFYEVYTKEKIDYKQVDSKINIEKEKGMEWLKNALKLEEFRTTTTLLEKKMCTGCAACVNICPKNALKLKQDEFGYYRAELEAILCVNCGLCEKVCPALKLPEKHNNEKPECVAFIAKEEEVLKSSSSGGVFSLLAREAFRKQGYVAGAAWKSDFSVEHILIDKEDDLHKLQKSKYLQTYIGDSFKKVKEKLQKGEFVLYTGCPCQIAGLKKYLGKEYDNLILVDLLCGNSPSAKFFKKYLDESFPQGILKYEFRNKKQGWNSECVKITLANGEELVRRGEAQDNYQRVYHNHTMCAPHCENCKYQALPRFGDLTIGDFWGYSKRDKDIDTKKGISVVLINNEKGKKYFDLIPQESINVKKNVPLEWLGGNGYALKGHNYSSPYRDRFYEAIQKISFSKAVEYAFSSQGVSNYPNATKCSPLQYNTAQMRFVADSGMWEEHFINGVTVLTTKTENPPLGYYACIPLMHTLVAGKKYRFSIRFKIQTESKHLNFHIKEALTKKLQIIHTHNVLPTNANNWEELETEFIPNSHVYSEFMVGAGHIKGKGRFLAIDYIDIREVD